MINQLLYDELNKCINNKSEFCPITRKECYAKGGVSLIFKNTLQNPKFLKKKIIFISDAPYNFPGSPSGYPNLNANTVGGFIQLHLQDYGLNRAGRKRGMNLSVNQCADKPSEIFDFIYLTFHPIFKYTPKHQWAQEFVDRIYWTSFCKRSYGAGKMPDACAELLKKEIALIQPGLIISVMKKGAYPEIFGTTYDDLEANQQNANGVFQFAFTTDGSRITIDLAVFPNPSGANAKMKVPFYSQNYITHLIQDIHNRL